MLLCCSLAELDTLFFKMRRTVYPVLTGKLSCAPLWIVENGFTHFIDAELAGCGPASTIVVFTTKVAHLDECPDSGH